MRTWTDRTVRITFNWDGRENIKQYLMFDVSDAEALVKGIQHFEDDYKGENVEIVEAEIVEKHTYTDEED